MGCNCGKLDVQCLKSIPIECTSLRIQVDENPLGEYRVESTLRNYLKTCYPRYYRKYYPYFIRRPEYEELKGHVISACDKFDKMFY